MLNFDTKSFALNKVLTLWKQEIEYVHEAPG